MIDNIFLKENKELELSDYMSGENVRDNLGEDIPLAVYRLMQYSLREELIHSFNQETQIKIFRNAGYRAGLYFVNTFLDITLPFHEFIAQLQEKMVELKIGVLRIEELDENTGKLILTVSEDADCSGLPILSTPVCNYDEGFIAGILSQYTHLPYEAIEIDCWATGDRVCRFKAGIKE